MKTPAPRRRSGGFTLIEVLIALVVLAFGLLGLGLLQTMNLRYTKSANERTQAVNLGGELLDMMRSNRSEIAAYAMPSTALSGLTPPASGCTTSPTLGAAANIARWQCEVRESLGPQAKVQVNVKANNVVDVVISWDESNLPSLANSGSITLTSQL